jgi:hypothetical protein
MTAGAVARYAFPKCGRKVVYLIANYACGQVSERWSHSRTPAHTSPLLSVENLNAWYDRSHVEQNVERALTISDRAYIMDQGRTVHEGSASGLLAQPEIQNRYCAF